MSVPSSSTLVPAFDRAPSSVTTPDTSARPLFAGAVVFGSRMVLAPSSTSLSPSEMGISAVTTDPRRALSVARRELGNPQNLNPPVALLVWRAGNGARRIPDSLDTSTSSQAIDTSTLGRGSRVSGSLTCPMTADSPYGPDWL